MWAVSGPVWEGKEQRPKPYGAADSNLESMDSLSGLYLYMFFLILSSYEHAIFTKEKHNC